MTDKTAPKDEKNVSPKAPAPPATTSPPAAAAVSSSAAAPPQVVPLDEGSQTDYLKKSPHLAQTVTAAEKVEVNKESVARLAALRKFAQEAHKSN